MYFVVVYACLVVYIRCLRVVVWFNFVFGSDVYGLIINLVGCLLVFGCLGLLLVVLLFCVWLLLVVNVGCFIFSLIVVWFVGGFCDCVADWWVCVEFVLFGYWFNSVGYW